MRLVKAHIKNFRAIGDLEVAIGQQTVLIGANGVGKSCVLKAIDKFFSKSANVSLEDFHEKNVNDPIEISLTFSDFSEAEAEEFSSRIHNDELSVTRVFQSGLGSRENGRYFGQSLRNPALQNIRAIDGGVQRRAAFNDLAGSEGFEDLEAASNAAQVQENMDSWEAAHPEKCEVFRDDGQFLGFSNVARGSLSKYLSFVFVPAVRDATADSVDARGSVIAQLIELVVKSVVQRRADIVAWRAQASEQYQELVKPENLEELGDLSNELTDTLGIFYSDSRVDLSWKPPEELQVALPIAEVALTEQGYTGPIENKGHGLQRAFIFTLLQHLAKALSARSDNEDEVPSVEDAPQEAQQTPAEETPHTVILAIEEPELYQHPIKQRHIAKVLRQISQGQIPGVMSSTQVLLCSHSPHFISTEHFDDIRLARREIVQEGAAPQCKIRSVSYTSVNAALDAAYSTQPGGHTAETLKARLHVVDDAVAEGFFCNVAVLVEGAGDRAALMAVAQARGVDVEAAGIAILPVGGKTNIDRPLAIFSLLRIPTYAIFDSDRNLAPDNQKVLQNRGIQRLSGEEHPQDFRTYISDRFASFEDNLNITLEAELGDSYADQVQFASFKYGMPQKQIVKNPVGLTEIVAGCMAAGGTCDTVGAIVDRIVTLAA